MKKRCVTVLLAGIVLAGTGFGFNIRPGHTFSIVALDKSTGELGVAVQSHWFSVGSSVPWAEAGVGAVATQSFIDPSYGALGLDLMRAGKSAAETLAALLKADAMRRPARSGWWMRRAGPPLTPARPVSPKPARRSAMASPARPI
jgi:hypothetical protein